MNTKRAHSMATPSTSRKLLSLLVSSGLVVGSLAVSSLVSGSTASAATGAIVLTTLASDSFTHPVTTSNNWTSIANSNASYGRACLTASSNPSASPIGGCGPSAIDTDGSGALRLTTNTGDQVGTVYNTSSLPTSQGLDIVFDTYQWNTTSTTPADGISFVLAATDPTNPAAPAVNGTKGGSLGYSTNNGSPGVANGYLGFGLDVYGNFNNAPFGGSSCPNTVFAPNSVTVRGPGNGTSGYCVAASTVSIGALDSPNAHSRPAAMPVEVALNPNSAAALTKTGLSVPAKSWSITWTPVGGSQQTLTHALPTASDLAGFPASYYDPATGLPYQLTYGFAASTGGANEIHEVNTLASTTLNGQLPAFNLAVSDDSNGTFANGRTSTATVTPSLDATQGSETQPFTVTTTFPAGVVPTNPTTTAYTCTTSGQVVSCTAPAALIAAGTSLPAIKIPVTVQAGATAPGTINAKVSSTDANPATASDPITIGQATPTPPPAPTPIQVATRLGSACGFAVLAGAAVTASASNVWGDVGAAAAATITATVIGGVLQSTTNTAAGLTDLATAYTALKALTPTGVLSGDDLGGQTITPGVYHRVAALALTTSVTFDAKGDPNAIFVIQSDAAMNTTAGSSMILTRGAKAANIYWVTTGAATLGGTSAFAGNILAYAAVTAGAGTAINGRAFSVTAAATLPATTITHDPGACSTI